MHFAKARLSFWLKLQEEVHITPRKGHEKSKSNIFCNCTFPVFIQSPQHTSRYFFTVVTYVLTICINFIMKEVAKYFSDMKLNYDIILLFLLKWYTVFVFIVLFPIFWMEYLYDFFTKKNFHQWDNFEEIIVFGHNTEFRIVKLST